MLHKHQEVKINAARHTNGVSLAWISIVVLFLTVKDKVLPSLRSISHKTIPPTVVLVTDSTSYCFFCFTCCHMLSVATIRISNVYASQCPSTTISHAAKHLPLINYSLCLLTFVFLSFLLPQCFCWTHISFFCYYLSSICFITSEINCGVLIF